MGWIAELGKSLKDITDLEKVGIFCFMIIAVLAMGFRNSFDVTIVLYCFALIVLFLYVGLHKNTTDLIKPHPLNPKESITEHNVTYDFASRFTKIHPYNNILRVVYLFLILGTITLVITFL